MGFRVTLVCIGELMRSICHPIRLILMLASAVVSFPTCSAQEVASVDLTKVEARVDLRRPKASSEMTGGYSGARSTTLCPRSTRNKGVLQTSLVSLDREDYEVGDEPTFEVTIQNTGSVPIQIPVSPHLADLQPKNRAEEFTYYELQIALWLASADRWSTNMGGSAILYGAENHADTMSTLNPGEWVRVVAKGKFRPHPDLLELTRSGFLADHAYAESSLFRNAMLITARNSATVAAEICVAQTVGRSVPIRLTIP